MVLARHLQRLLTCMASVGRQLELPQLGPVAAMLRERLGADIGDAVVTQV